MFPGETPGAATPDLSAALEQLWQKFLPQIEERIEILERAAAALSAGQLTPELRSEAHAAAHKLVGSLGTFGLADGSTLAREAESTYQDNLSLMNATHLADIVARLRTFVASRS